MAAFQKKSLHVLFFFIGVFVVFPFLNFSSGLDPETVWRTVAMGILLLPYLFYYIIRSIKGERSVLPFLNNRSIVFLFLYIIISFLSLIKAVNPGDGLFDVLKLFLYLAVIFIATQFLIENRENLDIMIKCINVSVVLFSTFGLIQLIHLINEAKDFNQSLVIGQSLRSSLGNKNSYAEVLLLSLPFCLYGLFEYRSIWKLFCAFNCILILLSIFILMNLYVWLGLAVSVVIVLVIMAGEKKSIFRDHKKLGIISIITLIIVLFISALFFKKSENTKAIRSKMAHALNYIKHPETIGRHDPAMNDNNIHERLVLAKNTAKMIKENWVVGVGVSNWKIYEPKYGQASITSNIRVDYPHNDYLCVFAETGIIGIACYVLFLFFAMGKAREIYKNTTDPKFRTLCLLMCGGISGFIIISFFGFAKEKFFPMILLLMMIAILPALDQRKTKERIGIWKLVLLLFIPAIILLVVAGVKRISSEMHLQKALKAKKFQCWNEVIDEAGKACSYFYPVDYSATPIHWYKGMAYFYSDRIDSALIYLTEGEQSNPYHVQLLNDIGTCYELKNDHNRSIQYYQKAFEMDPYLVRENLTAAYFNSDQLDKALDLATDIRFEKRVFLEEILKAKALKFHNTFTGNKEALMEKINTKGWLIDVFERSKLLKTGFEEGIRGEIAK